MVLNNSMSVPRTALAVQGKIRAERGPPSAEALEKVELRNTLVQAAKF